MSNAAKSGEKAADNFGKLDSDLTTFLCSCHDSKIAQEGLDARSKAAQDSAKEWNDHKTWASECGKSASDSELLVAADFRDIGVDPAKVAKLIETIKCAHLKAVENAVHKANSKKPVG